eukprot:gene835-9084_t
MSSICGSDDLNDLSEQLESIPSIVSVEPVNDKREYKDSESLYKEKYEKFYEILQQSTNIIILTEEKLSKPKPMEFNQKIPKKYKMIDEPTEEHNAVQTLLRKNDKVKHVITSSYNGLHFLSGLKEDELTEFYGSNFKEYCSKCKVIHQRYFDISKCPSKSRECEFCGGTLVEDKINEGDQLDTETFKKVKSKMKHCDLIIALGCDFLTQPLSDLPNMMFTNNFSGKFVIINSKKTPIDDLSRRKGVRIYDKPMNFLNHLFEDLKIDKDELPLLEKDKILNSLNEIVEKQRNTNSGFFGSVPQSDDLDTVFDIVSPRKRKKSEKELNNSRPCTPTSNDQLNEEKIKPDLKSEIFKELEEEESKEIEKQEEIEIKKPIEEKKIE